MKKVFIFILSFVLLVSVFAVVIMKNEPGDEAVASSGGGTLIVGITNDVDSFNPLFGESSMAKEITHLLLLGLADLNDRSEFVGELAETWEHSPDFLSVTYNLRRDAWWSDGVQITAADVKFTFDLLADTLVASPNSWVMDYIKNVEIVSPFMVKFEFAKAYPDQIFDTAGEIVPKHIFEHVDRKEIRSHTFGQKPVSSGPFILKRRVKNQFIELVRNKNYFGKKPNLERVIFKIVPDKTSLLLQLKNGEIDMMAGVNPDHVADLQSSNPDIALYRVSGRTYYYIGYNEKNPLFKEKQVRRALTMAIDRNGLIEATLQGYGKPCTGPVPPIVSWAYNDSIPPIPFNVAGAKNLLANAGWKDHDGDGWLDKDGRDFKFVLRTNAGNQIKADLAVIVQDQLKKIGVKVDIRSLEWTAFMDKLRRKEFDAYIGGWSTSFNVDPTPIFHSTATNLFNYIGYNNPQVDQLIEAGREEMNRQKAAKIWKTMQDEIYRDQPYTFLFWLDKIVAVNSKFKNVTPIPLSMFYGLENWYEAKISTD